MSHLDTNLNRVKRFLTSCTFVLLAANQAEPIYLVNDIKPFISYLISFLKF